MRKKITVRVLISIFMHLLIGAAFVIMANLLIRSDFTINYLDDEVTYVPSSAFAEEYEFEESDLYTEIYTRQLQDIITYCAIKNVFEKNFQTWKRDRRCEIQKWEVWLENKK